MTNLFRKSFTREEKGRLLILVSLIVFFALPEYALAATSGDSFKAVYTFVYDAATGYLGRSIAIIGGIIGMGYAAASGKVLPAIVGVMLAIFGSLGPAIINSLFASALI
ncbi:TrbC/VirB2 family protein [Cellvibrio sp.]|uniref:TrbC/VirB2 family protein n=1 Tax=Cellvibrio sp. TaxID=1965322 RepID=UPI0039647511